MTDLQPVRDIDAARRRAERIRIKARTITEQYESLRALIDEAERNEDHLALGYPSWTAYLADLFGDEPLRLPRDERIPMSQMLTEKGMSTRAIGAVLGTDQRTVRRDVAGAANAAPDPEPAADDGEVIDYETGEVLDGDGSGGTREDHCPSAPQPEAPKPEPGTVTGLDGKKYRRPEPKPEPAAPKRRALTDQAHDAAINLTAAVDRIARIFADDRLTANKKQVGDITRAHLLRTAEVCQDLASQL